MNIFRRVGKENITLVDTGRVPSGVCARTRPGPTLREVNNKRVKATRNDYYTVAHFIERLYYYATARPILFFDSYQ